MEIESSIKKAYEAILSGDFELAIQRFEEAIELEPDNGAVYYKCSITCARSGKWQKALHYAEQAVLLDSGHEEYDYHLQTVRAKAMVSEAEQLLSQSSPVKTDQALSMLIEASRMDPLNMEALLLLGTIYASLRRYDEGAAYAREAVRLEPEHAAARSLYMELKRKSRALRAYGQRSKRKRNR
ncbi:tetratricopeptide repeat protein [Paenibacillus sacheonensis]|uniref:Tetratricopeptide repeat protein n=1 Tax=Paenibacillus sacheonensis TaxID=742054 RepID=A0A7X5BXX5_9BACL|nr:tetratricopeptide repeat protein [Paenibacillus sacheonensis]MBM7564518.1 tetratricopeptide (TPR) repeat protein [Paenibacillus sacheonensis]NBC69077.1 tetratricopeptide repeat protein [Paenibacillus sacheonensis]